MTHVRISTVIVLYNSAILDSDTINTLFQTYRENVKLTVTIWNNGPFDLSKNDISDFIVKCKEYDINCEIYQDCRNVSLSKIYNLFISTHPETDHYVILDQDTLLSTDFFTNIYNNQNYHVIVPLIYSPDDSINIKSPSYFNHKPFHHGVFNLGDCYAVGSCISFSSHLVSLMTAGNAKCFNECYAFYRVDTEFFSALKKHRSLQGICIGNITHDLSEKKNPEKMSEFKKVEVGYDKLLSRIYNRNKNTLQNIIYCLKLKKKYRIKLSGFIQLLQCAIKKKHPRAQFEISDIQKIAEHKGNQ